VEGTSADYVGKSSCDILWGTAYTWKETEKTLRLSKRTLHFNGYSWAIRGGSACLFVRQPRGPTATLLPVANYKILCVKGKRGVILLGDFWPKSDPNGKEDTPHVRIIMEGDCS
jgi:hypothetical protein